MSQRKAKEFRQAMAQYKGVVEDVDDLKRRIGAMEARHRREDQMAEAARRRARAAAREQQEQERVRAQEQAEAERREARHRRNEHRRRIVRRRRITALACLAVVLLAMVWAIVMACQAVGGEERETILPEPVAVTPVFNLEEAGEDPQEAEKIEAALLEQGYFSDAIPLSYDLQDVMRTACEEYGCPYSLALAVAETESHFNMEAVGAAGEVGIMQLNPGPESTYWAALEADTQQDPTTPAGNIVCGVYLLETHLATYEDAEKALMAYNMGAGGASQAWDAGITSTEYSAKVMEAANRWEAVLG